MWLSDTHTGSLHNLSIDQELAVHELRELVEAGGRTIVDVSSCAAEGRDHHALKAISQRTGLQVVMATGGARGLKEQSSDALAKVTLLH